MQDPDLTKQLDLARQVFEADKADRLRKPTLPCHRLPTELLQAIHADLIEREAKLNDVVRTRKIVIAGGPKHFSALSQEEAAACTSYGLKDMLMPGVNKGKGLLLRASSDLCMTSAAHFLACDVHGWTVPVTVYHAGAKLQSQLMMGAVFFLREPYIKQKGDDYFIRVDSPLDLMLWPEGVRSGPGTHITPSASAAALKSEADKHFARSDYKHALHTYQQALCWHEGFDQLRSLLALNAAATMLKLDMPGAALRILHTLCHRDYLTSTQNQKRLHRILQAGMQLHHVPTFEELLHGVEDDLHIVRLADDFRDIVNQYQQLREKPMGSIKSGQDLYQAIAASGSQRFSEFQHTSLQVTKIADKGYALSTCEHIKSGTLLLVARPLASATVSCGPAYTLSLNLASGSLDTSAQTANIANLFDRLRDEPYLQALYETLHAENSDFPTREPPSLGSVPDILSNRWPAFDAGRMESICTLNSFTPRGLIAATDAEPDGLDHFHSPSALYLSASYMNHSCIGNARYHFVQDTLFLFAVRDIAANEEIVDSYCDPAAPLGDRRRHLARYGFVCQCPLCTQQEVEALAN